MIQEVQAVPVVVQAVQVHLQAVVHHIVEAHHPVEEVLHLEEEVLQVVAHHPVEEVVPEVAHLHLQGIMILLKIKKILIFKLVGIFE